MVKVTLSCTLLFFFLALFFSNNALPSEKTGNIEKKLLESQKKLRNFNEQIANEKKKIESLRKDKGNLLEEIKRLNNLIAANNSELEVYKTEYENNLILL